MSDLKIKSTVKGLTSPTFVHNKIKNVELNTKSKVFHDESYLLFKYYFSISSTMLIVENLFILKWVSNIEILCIIYSKHNVYLIKYTLICYAYRSITVTNV